MFAHMKEIVAQAEQAASDGGLDAALTVLRRLSLDDFGIVLLQMPHADFPVLSGVLPKMADTQVQQHWTGNSGQTLLTQSLTFVRSVAVRYQQLTHSVLQDVSILDFGCGYGRILRLMAYYAAPARIWGVDPFDQSIAICRKDRMFGNLAMSDYLPRSLPVDGARFNLIYAFSVFTHLSERTTRLALATLRDHLAADGVLVVTIRPREYWQHVAEAQTSGPDKESLLAQLAHHDREGFAFIPHDLAPIEGDITYGDTSMTLDWLAAAAPGLRIEGYDHSLDDPLQIIVYLRHDRAFSGSS